MKEKMYELFDLRSAGMPIVGNGGPSKMNDCMTEGCRKPAAGQVSVYRGLCMSCYKKAKDLVAANKVTWEQLAANGMCQGVESDPFLRSFSEKFGDMRGE